MRWIMHCPVGTIQMVIPSNISPSSLSATAAVTVAYPGTACVQYPIRYGTTIVLVVVHPCCCRPTSPLLLLLQHHHHHHHDLTTTIILLVPSLICPYCSPRFPPPPHHHHHDLVTTIVPLSMSVHPCCRRLSLLSSASAYSSSAATAIDTDTAAVTIDICLLCFDVIIVTVVV